MFHCINVVRGAWPTPPLNFSRGLEANNIEFSGFKIPAQKWFKTTKKLSSSTLRPPFSFRFKVLHYFSAYIQVKLWKWRHSASPVSPPCMYLCPLHTSKKNKHRYYFTKPPKFSSFQSLCVDNIISKCDCMCIMRHCLIIILVTFTFTILFVATLLFLRQKSQLDCFILMPTQEESLSSIKK